MIYAGIIHFNSIPRQEKILSKVIESYREGEVLLIRKSTLTLCYGKFSQIQDLDDIWVNDSSILIGRAFNKEASCGLGKEDFKGFSHLDAETVLEKIWGKYVYLHINKRTSQIEIVIDSVGQLPFFYYRFPDGNILFSSNIEVIYKILSQKPEYNWEYLCSYLIYGNSSSIQTPFKDIYEIPPACSLTVSKNEINTAPFWDPLNSYKTSNIQENNVVTVLNSTLKPWIEPYKNIYVSLSGGLDSSSLVYCLKELIKKDQNLKAINYFHSQIKSSNELSHARKVCEETRIDLIEIDASDFLPFDPPKGKLPLKPNKPFPGMVSLRWTGAIFEHTLPFDTSSMFVSGHGSDHIFMRPPSKKSCADYIIEKGFKGYKKQLESISEFYRAPHLSTLKENAKGLFSYWLSQPLKKRNGINTQIQSPKWIKQEVYQKASNKFVHPIYEKLPRKMLPGKYEQVDGLYEALASIHVEVESQADPTFYPFLYQPVVNFALSFPTYELFDKGYDRYPLRKAVSEVFQTSTVWRRDKSQTTGLFQLGLKKNLEQVLELCLGGHCVKQGLLHKEDFRKTINLIGNGDTKFLWSFMYIASLEIFLKYWEERL